MLSHRNVDWDLQRAAVANGREHRGADLFVLRAAVDVVTTLLVEAPRARVAGQHPVSRRCPVAALTEVVLGRAEQLAAETMPPRGRCEGIEVPPTWPR